jgi:rhodanese-related sulfurtransferase
MLSLRGWRRMLHQTTFTRNRFMEMVSKVKQEAKIEEIEPAELHRKLNEEGIYVVDVRETSEHAQGTIPGALCLPRGIVDRDIERFIPATTDAQLVLVCAGGVRSILAAESLKRMGFRNVYSLRGGMHGWTLQGLPIEKTQ